MGGEMKIGFCAAQKIGFQVIDFAAQQGYPIEFIATCFKDKSAYCEKIEAVAREKNIPLYPRVDANDPAFIAKIKKHEVDIVQLAWWPSIIRGDAIAAAKIGWINMHPSLLPFNRGKHPYYWSVVEGTPFGVTLHFIDEGVDSGDILFQREIKIGITDTADKIYARSLVEIFELFKESYPEIIRGELRAKKQDESLATFHWAKDLEPHSEIKMDKSYRASELIDIIRARSFKGGDCAYFTRDGKKFFVRIEIEEAPGFERRI